MATSKLTVANIALSKIGERAITSFLQSDSATAEAINAVYDDILREVLSEHPWSFAKKRVALTATVPADTSRTINGRRFTPVTITGATAANPVVVTAADHGLQDGDRIKIVGVSGMTELNGNFYRVANRTADTFSLANEDTEADVNGLSYTAYTSGGQVQLANDGNPITITAATAADPVVITAASHGFSDDDWVYILGVAGMTDLNGSFYIVDDATTNTFSLNDTDGNDVDGSAFDAYTYGGIILAAPEMVTIDNFVPVVYDKPSDYVRLLKKSSESAIIQVEQDKIISDESGVKIIYTFLNQDATQYFAQFVQALATRLAAEVSFRVTNSTTKSEALMELYQKVVLPNAMSVDSVQSTPPVAMEDEWLDSRINRNWPVTTGEVWHSL